MEANAEELGRAKEGIFKTIFQKINKQGVGIRMF